MSPEPEQLKPALERAQNELDSRLAEACENHGADESTGQLIRLEELLTNAAQAAKEAISIRRRLGADRRRESDHDDTGRSSSGAEEVATDTFEGIRDFIDANGCLWHVWEVPAEQLSARARPGTYAGDFEGGWLAFESGDGTERRRLPGYPREWRDFTNERIEALCREAKPVTRRKRAANEESEHGDADPPPPP